MSAYASLTTCPYNPAHRIQKLRLVKHILKCRKNHTDMSMETCPFNATHVIPCHQFKAHLLECPDNAVVLKSILIREEESANSSSSCSEYTDDEEDEGRGLRGAVLQPELEGEEWGAADPVGSLKRGGYDPFLASLLKPFVRRAPSGLAKGARKTWTAMEVQRVKQLQQGLPFSAEVRDVLQIPASLDSHGCLSTSSPLLPPRAQTASSAYAAAAAVAAELGVVVGGPFAASRSKSSSDAQQQQQQQPMRRPCVSNPGLPSLRQKQQLLQQEQQLLQQEQHRRHQQQQDGRKQLQLQQQEQQQQQQQQLESEQQQLRELQHQQQEQREQQQMLLQQQLEQEQWQLKALLKQRREQKQQQQRVLEQQQQRLLQQQQLDKQLQQRELLLKQQQQQKQQQDTSHSELERMQKELRETVENFKLLQLENAKLRDIVKKMSASPQFEMAETVADQLQRQTDSSSSKTSISSSINKFQASNNSSNERLVYLDVDPALDNAGPDNLELGAGGYLTPSEGIEVEEKKRDANSGCGDSSFSSLPCSESSSKSSSRSSVSSRDKAVIQLSSSAAGTSLGSTASVTKSMSSIALAAPGSYTAPRSSIMARLQQRFGSPMATACSGAGSPVAVASSAPPLVPLRGAGRGAVPLDQKHYLGGS